MSQEVFLTVFKHDAQINSQSISMTLIYDENLTKRFGNPIVVEDLSLHVHEGKVFGFHACMDLTVQAN
jgi:hypothetical protein